MAEKETEERTVETPTPDPVAELRAQMAELTKRADAQDKTLGRKETENKRLREQLDDRSEDKAFNQAMLGYLSKATGKSYEDLEGEIKGAQPDFVGEYKKTVKEMKEERTREDSAKALDDLQKRVTKLGYGEDSKEYWEIFGRAAGRNLDQAFARVEELEVLKQAPQPEVKQKSEDEVIAEHYEKQGLLKTDTGGPSGGAGGKAYTPEEFTELLKDRVAYKEAFPTISDLNKAAREGRIPQRK